MTIFLLGVFSGVLGTLALAWSIGRRDRHQPPSDRLDRLHVAMYARPRRGHPLKRVH